MATELRRAGGVTNAEADTARVQTSQNRMISRFMTAVATACAVGLFIGCHHREAAIAIVAVPVDLDSAGVARWLGQQRAACRGHLLTFSDEGAIRNFDSTGTRTEVRYRSGLVGVQCRP